MWQFVSYINRRRHLFRKKRKRSVVRYLTLLSSNDCFLINHKMPWYNTLQLLKGKCENHGPSKTSMVINLSRNPLNPQDSHKCIL